MICIGFDPGLDGAVAFVWPDGHAVVEDLPTRPKLGGGAMVTRVIDANALYRLIATTLNGSSAVAIVENVHTMPGGGMATQASLVDSRARIEATLELARLGCAPPLEPQTWKRAFGLIAKGKTASREIAASLYPRLRDRLARKKDHNRAEAILIAHHLRRTME